MTTVTELVGRLRPGRRIDGVVAVLLPFTAEGDPDLHGLAKLVSDVRGAGLTPAVNMDTGFGPQIDPQLRLDVLGLVRGGRFISGVMPFGHDADPERAYRAEVDAVCKAGGTPIVFPSPALQGLDGPTLATFVGRVVSGAPEALAFELGEMFAPFGRIFDTDTVRRLMSIPNLVGLKHSSLSRRLEWARLALRDAERPDFRIYTGNDLAIDMTCYGSDYLLGLATFDPAAFAVRDQFWREQDPRFFELNDALQAVGRVAFREPVPAYKHSACIYLKLTGDLDHPYPHPSCPTRPAWEAELLEPLAGDVRVSMARA